MRSHLELICVQQFLWSLNRPFAHVQSEKCQLDQLRCQWFGWWFCCQASLLHKESTGKFVSLQIDVNAGYWWLHFQHTLIYSKEIFFSIPELLNPVWHFSYIFIEHHSFTQCWPCIWWIFVYFFILVGLLLLWYCGLFQNNVFFFCSV